MAKQEDKKPKKAPKYPQLKMILADTPIKFGKTVTKHAHEGWFMWGDPMTYLDADGNRVFAQGMYKPEEKEELPNYVKHFHQVTKDEDGMVRPFIVLYLGDDEQVHGHSNLMPIHWVDFLNKWDFMAEAKDMLSPEEPKPLS